MSLPFTSLILFFLQIALLFKCSETFQGVSRKVRWGLSGGKVIFRRARNISPVFSVFESVEDEEERESFQSIAKGYLRSLFLGTTQASSRSIDEVEPLLKSIFPPMTPQRLEKEITSSLLQIRANPMQVQIDAFVEAMMNNPYWEEAGPMVVKELIFLDCLYHYYHQNLQLLSNNDYNELKDQLSWEGSMVAGLRGKEALFITAVASHRRGSDILSNHEYERLKQELLEENSWVVTRGLDPLEKLGFKTFMSYLHRSLLFGDRLYRFFR